MKKLNNLTYFLVTFIFLTATNFYFSNLIPQKISHGWEFSNGIVNMVYVENTGAAFSLMQNSTTFLIILSSIALLVILYYIFTHLETILKKEILFLSILIAGISGNLYERVIFGCVRDFFDLAFVNFPIFNISDIFINIGVFGIIVLILFTKKSVRLL